MGMSNLVLAQQEEAAAEIEYAATMAERERCAKIALAHKGSAARTRQQRGQSFRNMPLDAAQEIQAEERGEDIAAEIIARNIRGS